MFHLYASILIFNLAAYLMPKRLSRVEIYATSLFALVLQSTTDVYLDLGYDLYGYFNRGPDILTMLPVFGIYPALGTIFLNYYPYRGNACSKGLYILGWTLFSVVYERTAIHAGWFYFNGWTSLYSAVAYPLIYLILARNLRLLRKLENK